MSSNSQVPDELFDLFIIGGGPASLTAAIYSARACLKTAFIEKDWPGGKLNKTLYIENYPGYLKLNGSTLGESMLKQVLDNGVKQYFGTVIDVEKEEKTWKIRTANNQLFRSKSILIASGMRERVLDIDNVKEFYGKGISYCAICDGNLYRERPVIVVGGGNSAVEESIYLSDITSKVKLVHRRREFRAEAISVKKARNIKNIEIYTPYIPIGAEVKDNKIIGLKVRNVETEEESLLEGDCVFFYVGLIPENEFLKSIDIEKDEWGFLKVDENMRTSVPGIYAAGDIISKNLRQVVTATNDGAIAAISIKSYIDSLEESD
ncbi:thioredoxin reductase [Mycoplasma haemocanis str. Illinois]|uniref:Thioredoxin reductase n=1 Tax=Mycoplasma haemocanis (strain Illinois) TaxID=1111676 RepID=H6N5F7_MYCHN|nr:FAD-dependent oxidoreductase [Mycoplasma haemocanis]AEW44917.1 thioredoxin reductase [Mycoplasma haemocanis str. Illinois]